jgi:hypothetical protein
MNARRLGPPRWGRCSQEYTIVLAMILVACIAVIRVLGPEQAPDPRPLWDRVLASLLGLLQCFGVVVCASVLLASVEIVKQTAARYHLRRLEAKRARLLPLVQDARDQGTAANLGRITRALADRDDAIRRQGLAAAFTLLRGEPSLGSNPRLRGRLEQTLLEAPGFSRTLADTPADAPLLERVTLGAKLGAGTAEKRCAPVTSDAWELARWVDEHRRAEAPQEVQVSVGYDTGSLPYLEERGRFIALYLFIASTDLKRFMALLRRPPRDPNAAYGLLIRGDVVEVRFTGQARGARLDYVFPLPARLSATNLGGLFREIQLLNLGLLVACSEETWRVLLPGANPPWLDARRRAVARTYRDFERKLVAMLRKYDRRRNPEFIHRLAPLDHAERVRAFRVYRLEECLYPQYSWVVPLYDADTRWDRLLAPLRCVEGMLLHQGEVPDREVTCGMDFIQQVRQLGYQSATLIEQALAGPEAPEVGNLPPDPFIDPGEEEATRWYLSRVGQAMALGETWPERTPDPVTFRRASAYYEVTTEPVACPREAIPEVES